jgi:sugar diacid utilization regulator
VLLLEAADEAPIPLDRPEVLRMAAAASLMEVAVVGARDELAERLRGTLLEELRHGGIDPEETVRRAARLGCDLGRGAVAVVAEPRGILPSRAASLIRAHLEGAIAEPVGDRIYGILPARGGDDAPERVLAAAERLVERLRKHSPAAHSSFHPDPEKLSQAIREAELVLDVIARDERLAGQIGTGATDGVYRLLFQALATGPEEVRRFYEDTVAPVVRYDRQYRTGLLGTLESYLAHNCNMNATARGIFAHRHTVAYRLERVRELTGLDPFAGGDRERLGLGLKAYRLIEPTLPR